VKVDKALYTGLLKMETVVSYTKNVFETWSD